MLRVINMALLVIFLMFGFILFDTVSVLAEEDETKYYISLKAPFIMINGDFDGKLDSLNQKYLLYELEENIGRGLVFGASNNMYACEIGYAQSKHNVVDFSPKSTAELESLNISVKIFPSSSAHKRCRPYGLVGGGITKLLVENGAYLGGYGDAEYQGSGFHLGFGLNCKLNKKIAIDGSFAYYRYSMDKIELFDVVEHEPPKDDVMMTNTVVSLGIQYYF